MKYIVTDINGEFITDKNMKEVSSDLDDAILFTEEEVKKIESSMTVDNDIPQYLFVPLNLENDAFIYAIISEMERWIDIPDEEYDKVIQFIQTECRQFVDDVVNYHSKYGQLIRSIAEDIDLSDFE